MSELPRFVVRKDEPLITQRVDPKYSLVTAPRYEKWYELYLITPDGSFREIEWKEYPKELDMWYDHCPIPADVVEFCNRNGYKMELQVFDAICRRYLADWVETGIPFTREFETQNINTEVFPTLEDLQAVLIEEDLTLTY
ncbi:MAG: hypothetical protein NC548_53235 [Lachnospiraceae bacterium]|nr:hypothetical protein [Lachnospiraceae bacterium]MCM1233254.1 hypothetical protein [Ruminococcus flavefaciens]